MIKTSDGNRYKIIIFTIIIMATVGIGMFMSRQPPDEGCCRDVGSLSKIEALRIGGNWVEIPISESQTFFEPAGY